MGEDLRIFTEPPAGLCWEGSRAPAIRGSYLVDPAQWGPVTTASGKPGELEQHLQTLCALVRTPGMGRYASTFRQ